jgi:hypothetical protein
MSLPFKIHELLSASELEELEAFAREPGRTVDETHEWLQARGFTVSRTGVWNWKRKFDEQVLAERFARSSELASALKGAVEGGRFGDVADAAVMQLTQVVFEQAARLDADGSVKSGDLLNMAISLKSLVGSKQQLTRMLAEKFDAEMSKEAQKRPDRTITSEQIAEARKRIFGC